MSPRIRNSEVSNSESQPALIDQVELAKNNARVQIEQKFRGLKREGALIDFDGLVDTLGAYSRALVQTIGTLYPDIIEGLEYPNPRDIQSKKRIFGETEALVIADHPFTWTKSAWSLAWFDTNGKLLTGDEILEAADKAGIAPLIPIYKRNDKALSPQSFFDLNQIEKIKSLFSLREERANTSNTFDLALEVPVAQSDELTHSPKLKNKTPPKKHKAKTKQKEACPLSNVEAAEDTNPLEDLELESPQPSIRQRIAGLRTGKKVVARSVILNTLQNRYKGEVDVAKLTRILDKEAEKMGIVSAEQIDPDKGEIPDWKTSVDAVRVLFPRIVDEMGK